MYQLKFFQEASPEQPRQHAHRQEEARLAGDPAFAIEGQPATGNDAMHMRMMCQRRTPGVQHQRRADPCTQMLGVGCDGTQRFRCDLKQQSIDHRLVGVGNLADRCGQGEHHMVIVHRQ